MQPMPYPIEVKCLECKRTIAICRCPPKNPTVKWITCIECLIKNRNSISIASKRL